MPGVKRINAAGAIVLREKESKKQVLLVHRPSYDDWSLPKGKLDPDEYLAACAVRETKEETATDIRLGIPVERISYPVSNGQKSVSYWRGRVLSEGRHKPNAEIDRTAWVTIPTAMKRMTYPHERDLLRAAVDLPESIPLLVVRHARAMDRKNWSGKDQLRRLSSRGRLQSSQLVPLLAAYGVSDLDSSSSLRCTATLQPYARANRLEVHGWSTLSEEQAANTPAAVTKLIRRLAKETAESGVPRAVCGHRPVLPLMLEALGVPPRPMLTAAVMVAHLSPKGGELLAVEWHKPRS